MTTEPPLGRCVSGKPGYPTPEAAERMIKRLLASQTTDRALCAFATAPDVVGDAAATLERSKPHLPAIRDLGYPAALVAQDGLEYLDVPWDDFDVVFIGGSTAWKLSAAARDITRRAVARGKPVHMGRVNSYRRLSYARDIGCTSADGTFPIFGPNLRTPEVRWWLRRLHGEEPLFDIGAWLRLRQGGERQLDIRQGPCTCGAPGTTAQQPSSGQYGATVWLGAGRV